MPAEYTIDQDEPAIRSEGKGVCPFCGSDALIVSITDTKRLHVLDASLTAARDLKPLERGELRDRTGTSIANVNALSGLDVGELTAMCHGDRDACLELDRRGVEPRLWTSGHVRVLSGWHGGTGRRRWRSTFEVSRLDCANVRDSGDGGT